MTMTWLLWATLARAERRPKRLVTVGSRVGDSNIYPIKSSCQSGIWFSESGKDLEVEA